MASERDQLRAFAGTTLLLAAAFWIWAIVNTAQTGFDLGVVSFLTVILSSIYLLSPRGDNPGTFASAVVFATFLFVSFNYVLGAIEGARQHKEGFMAYCTIFAFLWFILACAFWSKMSAVRYDASRSREDNEATLREDLL